MRLYKLVLAIGSVAVAASVFVLTTPKAVYAVTAAMVQVTNTALNPAVIQSTDHQAAQILDLQCPTNNVPCTVINKDTDNYNGSSTYFQVPTGKSFVVTSVDITARPDSQACSTSRDFFLQVASGNGHQPAFSRWHITPNQNYHFTYPTGIVFGSGSYLYVEDDENVCQTYYTGEFDAVFLQGYLTSN
ncbi:hypothetical protein [Granulicella sp. L60]|jgi:hypothetical protein|uniref:hypothetical protein n=1 Tax=Granulicella sp. L60 TaxID=1641866 RepID=UPI00131C3480|nr:hypothetical protein [Granulicella sp. L60]